MTKLYLTLALLVLVAGTASANHHGDSHAETMMYEEKTTEEKSDCAKRKAEEAAVEMEEMAEEMEEMPEEADMDMMGMDDEEMMQ